MNKTTIMTKQQNYPSEGAHHYIEVEMIEVSMGEQMYVFPLETEASEAEMSRMCAFPLKNEASDTYRWAPSAEICLRLRSMWVSNMYVFPQENEASEAKMSRMYAFPFKNEASDTYRCGGISRNWA